MAHHMPTFTVQVFKSVSLVMMLITCVHIHRSFFFGGIDGLLYLDKEVQAAPEFLSGYFCYVS